ncbi:MAG: phospholipase B family protein [Bacteroidales bacterium]|nr:phospholipase B family protein [Bacteroidales bacterium]MCI1785966.1 phospholipase B family protein [Bacteroidales bacterium]
MKTARKIYLNEHCMGFGECSNNCWNFTIFSTDPSQDDLTQEYYAGYVQGKLQGMDMIRAARNNTWRNTYLCDPSHSYPKSLDPSREELDRAAGVLADNYNYLCKWLSRNTKNDIAHNIERLLYRMIGIYDGVSKDKPQTTVQLELKGMPQSDLQLAYGEDPLTFMDIYFINAQMDLFDVISNSVESKKSGSRECKAADSSYYIRPDENGHRPESCSAFVKRTKNDIYWTHNSWCGFLAQSCAVHYVIGNEFVSQNAYCPGEFGSNMDFGFNKHGICFNETTHRYGRTEAKAKGIWLCWRAAAAEMFAESIKDFYRYVSIDNTGTYLNGYMLIDSKTGETGLVEMSYKRFVLYTSDGGDYEVTDSIDGKTTPFGYDTELLNKEHIFGINFPVSYNVKWDLESTDNRPMRRIQFSKHIGSVKDMETSKNLITYVEDNEPLSLYGRWDLGKGTTAYPKTIPDGAVDSKAFSANEVARILKSCKFQPDEKGGTESFWMVYGTSKIKGEPFVWSESQWKDVPLEYVPDRLEGKWERVKMFMK